jgi:hypothetical protein
MKRPDRVPILQPFSGFSGHETVSDVTLTVHIRSQFLQSLKCCKEEGLERIRMARREKKAAFGFRSRNRTPVGELYMDGSAGDDAKMM